MNDLGIGVLNALWDQGWTIVWHSDTVSIYRPALTPLREEVLVPVWTALPGDLFRRVEFTWVLWLVIDKLVDYGFNPESIRNVE